jgi:phage gp29-like protein
MKILDQHGDPIDPGVLKETQTARVVNLQNEYLVSHLDGLTPARLAQTLASADNGDLWSQHRLFADMEERDAHLAAEMNKRKLALLGLSWRIDPPREASASEKKNAEWLTDVLSDAVDPLEDVILALMDGVGHGFAPVELEWRREGRDWLPAFFPRPQEWFQLDHTRRDIRLRDNTADGAPLSPFGWIFHTHGKAKTGYLGRLGIHRTLSWPFVYKSYAIGDFAEFLETFGLPLILGKYFSGAGSEEKASLLRAVSALGHDARAIMPQDMQIEVMKVVSSTGSESTPHMVMADWAERSESKIILGQTMSAEAKSSGIGSGNAELHGDVRHDILMADARQIAGTLTLDLLYPLVALNRGLGSLSRCPKFVFDLGEAEDVSLYADALPKLVGVGLHVPLAWAHDKLRIPLPADGEELLSAAASFGGLAPASEEGMQGNGVTEQAALSAQAPAQDGFDALAERMADDWQPCLSPLIGTVRDAIARCATLEEFRERLSELSDAHDSEHLVDVLTQALFAARVTGRVVGNG